MPVVAIGLSSTGGQASHEDLLHSLLVLQLAWPQCGLSVEATLCQRPSRMDTKQLFRSLAASDYHWWLCCLCAACLLC